MPGALVYTDEALNIVMCRIVGAYDDLVESGRIVLQERDGFRVLVDLTKQDKSDAIAILEEVLAQSKGG